MVVDGHGHCHDCFALDGFFDSALTNLASNASSSRGKATTTPSSHATKHLMILAGIQHHPLEKLLGRRDRSAWNIELLESDLSAVAHRGRHELFLLAARQVTTAEGLEVLALGGEVAEGLGLTSAVEQIWDRGNVAILPWGFGKWIGRRGRVLRDFLEGASVPNRTYLGDNGGRPSIIGMPDPNRLALEFDLHLLPGSDPLPLPQQADRIGSLGFVTSGLFDENRPFASFIDCLTNEDFSSQPFGRLMNPVASLATQLAYRFRGS